MSGSTGSIQRPSPSSTCRVAPASGRRARLRRPRSTTTSSEILIPVASNAKHGQPVARGERADDGLDVLGLGRCDLHALLSWQADPTVTREFGLSGA